MRLLLHEILEESSQRDRKSNGVAIGWRQGDGDPLFNGDSISAVQDEESSRDWLHDNTNALNATEQGT